MKSRIFLQAAVIASIIVAILLADSMLSSLFNDRVVAPYLPVVIGFFVTVLFGVILGSWLAFKGEKTYKIPLLISLLVASGVVFLLFLLSGVSLQLSPVWNEYHPLAVYNLSVTTSILFLLTCILAVVTIAVLVSIIKSARERLL